MYRSYTSPDSTVTRPQPRIKEFGARVFAHTVSSARASHAMADGSDHAGGYIV